MSFKALKRFPLVAGALCALMVGSVSDVVAQPFFESTWATALGQSDNAVRDGGNWDSNGGNGQFIDIQPISGPSLPTELNGVNMAQVSMDGATGWQMVVENVNTNTASNFYYRFYVRVKAANGFQYGSLHPWQDFQDLSGGLSTNFYIGVSTVDSQTWRPAFWSYLPQASDGPSRFGVRSPAFGGPAEQLLVDRWYRVEGHMQYTNRVTSGGGIPYVDTIYNIRIYDDQNRQVISSANFTAEICDGSGCSYSYSLQAHNDAGNRFRFRSGSSTFTMGVNSPAGASGQAPIYDMTAVAFSNSGWIGQFGGGGNPPDVTSPSAPTGLQVE